MVGWARFLGKEETSLSQQWQDGGHEGRDTSRGEEESFAFTMEKKGGFSFVFIIEKLRSLSQGHEGLSLDA